MNTLIEKILIYIVGGMLGGILGYIITNIEIIMFTDSLCKTVTVLGVFVGVLSAVVYVEHKEKKNLKENALVRNETVALITHEMRTGLTSTGWALRKVVEKYGEHLTEKDKSMLEGVYKSIQTTISHSLNLLDISLLDIGELSIALEKIDLEKIDKMFNEVLDKFKLNAESQGIDFQYSVSLDGKRQVESDTTRLRIILENILENALHYTIGDIKVVKVHITNDKENLLIQVKDSGIGIPDSEKGNIFKEFYRAQNARKVLSSGSGIGLFTTKQYVLAHKGKINFESKEGVGTTFSVSIPLKSIADVEGFLEKV